MSQDEIPITPSPESIRGGFRKKSRSGRRGAASEKRQTEPKGWSPFQSYSLGIVPRRRIQQQLNTTDGFDVKDFGTSKPMHLLRILIDAHPSVGLATWNALRLTCPTDGLKISVYKRSDSSDKIPDDKMKKEIENLFKNQPKEIGGLIGLQTQLTIQALFTGLITLECVPGPKFTGVRRIWPVDSLSIEFGRKDRDSDLVPFQNQIFPDKSPAKNTRVNNLGALSTNKVALNPITFMWRALDCDVDDPYGRAPFAPALSEALADLALMQDLRDAVHNAAWPRLDVGIDMKMLYETAAVIYRITDPNKAAEWVNARFQEVVDYVSNLYADDNIVHHSSGNVSNLQPGSFSGLEPVLTFLRQRIVQALKSLPTLMGINDGATFNYTSVEWQIYAQGLETLRNNVAEVIRDVCDLHIRLLGSDSYTEITYTPIRTNDALVDANTENIEILNAMNLMKLGFISLEEACVQLTGHKPVSKPMPGVFDDESGSEKNRPSDGTIKGTRKADKDNKNPGAGGGNQEDTTQEERDVKK